MVFLTPLADSRRLLPVFIVTLVVFASPQSRAPSPPPTKSQLDFFESKIRPIFADNCYKCHSPANGAPRNGLELDWKGRLGVGRS
jgi:cytochrome c5